MVNPWASVQSPVPMRIQGVIAVSCVEENEEEEEMNLDEVVSSRYPPMVVVQRQIRRGLVVMMDGRLY